MTKLCAKCQVVKPLSEFNARTKGKDGYQSVCKSCFKVYRDERKVTPEVKAYLLARKRDRRLRRLGLTKQQYNAMLESQGGVCAICGGVDENKALAVDHCHASGNLRELLCSRCNLVLGLFNDEMVLMKKAFYYLKKHRP